MSSMPMAMIVIGSTCLPFLLVVMAMIVAVI